jgi:hypothetical protein
VLVTVVHVHLCPRDRAFVACLKSRENAANQGDSSVNGRSAIRGTCLALSDACGDEASP